MSSVVMSLSIQSGSSGFHPLPLHTNEALNFERTNMQSQQLNMNITKVKTSLVTSHLRQPPCGHWEQKYRLKSTKVLTAVGVTCQELLNE